jgi:AcrR family transcriptional regulator
MPYPAQTDPESIVQVARKIIEQEGVEQLSLTRLAAQLGIKAPSLYRHIPNKAALLQAVNSFTFQQLFQAYETAIQAAPLGATEQLLSLFRAHRAFAHKNPETYILAFTTTLPEQRADEQMLEQLVLPIQSLMATISGSEQSLAALRGALALVHGFSMLELKEQFKRGGDIAIAFEVSITAYLSGWQCQEKWLHGEKQTIA